MSNNTEPHPDDVKLSIRFKESITRLEVAIKGNTNLNFCVHDIQQLLKLVALIQPLRERIDELEKHINNCISSMYNLGWGRDDIANYLQKALSKPNTPQ